jgi:hypothetical protein
MVLLVRLSSTLSERHLMDHGNVQAGRAIHIDLLLVSSKISFSRGVGYAKFNCKCQITRIHGAGSVGSLIIRGPASCRETPPLSREPPITAVLPAPPPQYLAHIGGSPWLRDAPRYTFPSLPGLRRPPPSLAIPSPQLRPRRPPPASSPIPTPPPTRPTVGRPLDVELDAPYKHEQGVRSQAAGMIPFRLSKQDATLARRCHGRMTGKQPLSGTSDGVETKTIPASQPSTMYIAIVLCLPRQSSNECPFNLLIDGRTFAAVAPLERSFGSRRTSSVQE